MNAKAQKLANEVHRERQQRSEEQRAAWRSTFVATRLDAGREAQQGKRQSRKENQAAGEEEPHRPRRSLGY